MGTVLVWQRTVDREMRQPAWRRGDLGGGVARLYDAIGRLSASMHWHASHALERASEREGEHRESPTRHADRPMPSLPFCRTEYRPVRVLAGGPMKKWATGPGRTGWHQPRRSARVQVARLWLLVPRREWWDRSLVSRRASAGPPCELTHCELFVGVKSLQTGRCAALCVRWADAAQCRAPPMGRRHWRTRFSMSAISRKSSLGLGIGKILHILAPVQHYTKNTACTCIRRGI